ncbi:uncharacterized protein [Populus alba]|uniref:uncharacterized protein n=1 Tax=Populus alba TaxID=43335 RepID=UPI001588B55A|nr:zinc finger MYM-type protein 1-like [Populus alba]
MAVVIRYVDNNGHIIECFLGIQHVSNTTASSLKAVIKALFSKHGLSISRLRGQGYDGASNMRGEFNGLKALILNNNPSAYYVHCFAHRLQLTLVAVTKKHNEVRDVFNFISSIINIVGASCNRMEVIREKQYARIIEGLENGEISSGQDLNQETSLRRYGDTRWGSHYITIIRLLAMFSSVLDVLEIIREDGMNSEQRMEAIVLTEKLICLALFYPSEFSIMDLMVLGDQLDTYIIDLRGDDELSGIKVTTATVERVFSSMHIVKSRLRNMMGDKWMNDSLVVYTEKDIFNKIDNEAIMKRF